MRKLIFLAAAVILFVLVSPAHAQAECGFDTPCEQEGYYDDSDPFATKTVKCTNSYGCPACALSQDHKTSVCYVLQGAWGYCSCSPQQPYYDKYGILRPNCQKEGSCSVR